MEPFKSYHIGGQKKKKRPMLCSSLNVAHWFNKWRNKYAELTESLKVLEVSLHSKGVDSWSLSRGAGKASSFTSISESHIACTSYA